MHCWWRARHTMTQLVSSLLFFDRKFIFIFGVFSYFTHLSLNAEHVQHQSN